MQSVCLPTLLRPCHPVLSDLRIKKRRGMKAFIYSWSMSIIILLDCSGLDAVVLLVVWSLLLRGWGWYASVLSDNSLLIFHKDTQLCKPWRDFLNQMIEIGVGKDLLGHFSLTLASDCAASNKQDEASAPSFGRLASTIQLIHTANTFSLTFNSQLTALFFIIQFSKKKNKSLFSYCF